jgi:hypothetical protein
VEAFRLASRSREARLCGQLLNAASPTNITPTTPQQPTPTNNITPRSLDFSETTAPSTQTIPTSTTQTKTTSPNQPSTSSTQTVTTILTVPTSSNQPIASSTQTITPSTQTVTTPSTQPITPSAQSITTVEHISAAPKTSLTEPAPAQATSSFVCI